MNAAALLVWAPVLRVRCGCIAIATQVLNAAMLRLVFGVRITCAKHVVMVLLVKQAALV